VAVGVGVLPRHHLEPCSPRRAAAPIIRRHARRCGAHPGVRQWPGHRWGVSPSLSRTATSRRWPLNDQTLPQPRARNRRHDNAASAKLLATPEFPAKMPPRRKEEAAGWRRLTPRGRPRPGRAHDVSTQLQRSIQRRLLRGRPVRTRRSGTSGSAWAAQTPCRWAANGLRERFRPGRRAGRSAALTRCSPGGGADPPRNRVMITCRRLV